MKYKIKKQTHYDERLFELEDENGDTFLVDFYTGGAFEPPEGADKTEESWKEWLGSFVGKTIETEGLHPISYFTTGETKLVPPTHK